MTSFIIGTALFLQTAVQMGTPLLYATLGEILTEKAGNLNLGVEGMMLLGAAFGFLVGYTTENPTLAILAAGAAGAAGALIYAILTVTFKSNQTVTGVALTIFGIGVANFVGNSLGNLTLKPEFVAILGTKEIPLLADLPLVGIALFQQSYFVHLGLILAVLMYLYLNKTKYGLALRVVGENPAAAEVAGIRVDLYKYVHIVIGGLFCGLGGAYLTLVFMPRWQETVTAGMGWIAVALVIFSTWNPLKAILGACFFGALKGLTYKVQNLDLHLGGLNIEISSQIMDLLPYLMTIIVLILITLGNKRENQAPAWLGKPYFKEDR